MEQEQLDGQGAGAGSHTLSLVRGPRSGRLQSAMRFPRLARGSESRATFEMTCPAGLHGAKKQSRGTPFAPSQPLNRSLRAFTLIELLISIGIIGVLIGIAAPALFRVRASAGQTQSLANLHNLGLSLHAYAEENQQRWPFPPVAEGAASSTGGSVYGPVATNPDGLLEDAPGVFVSVLLFSSIWDMDGNWPTVMHSVAPWPEHYETWLSPGRLTSIEPNHSLYDIPVSYQYSHSFLASPRVWSGAAGVSDADVGPTRTTDVAHPSSKVVMFDADRSYLRDAPTPSDRRPLLFADSSASARLDSDAAPGVPNPLNHGSARIFHNTPQGILGRDY